MQTTIIKIGNSMGSRFKSEELRKLGIKEGDEVEVIIKKAAPDRKKAVQALRDIAAAGGPLTKIDIESWERTRRAKLSPWEEVERDIARHQSSAVRRKKAV